jgi:hypothetical protein
MFIHILLIFTNWFCWILNIGDFSFGVGRVTLIGVLHIVLANNTITIKTI